MRGVVVSTPPVLPGRSGGNRLVRPARDRDGNRCHRVHVPPPFGGVETPYLLASIRLDGVEGGITHRVLGDRIPEKGTVVAVKFMEGVPAHPLLRAAFEIEGRAA